MSKLTIKELLELKGKRQLVLTTAFDEWTARAAEEAGVDMIVSWGMNLEHSKWAAGKTSIPGILSPFSPL